MLLMSSCLFWTLYNWYTIRFHFGLVTAEVMVLTVMIDNARNIPLQISFFIHIAYQWLQVHTHFIAKMTTMTIIHIKPKVNLAFMSFTISLISLTTISTLLISPLSSKPELLPPLDASAPSSFGVAHLINLSQPMHL